MWIKQIDLTDGGDGSTCIKITMTNGGQIFLDEQVPHDGKVVIPFDEYGKQQTPQVHMYDYDKDEWGPDEYAD